MPDSEKIVCPIAPWYFKRMGLMSLMFIAFGGWFFYDAIMKYPDQVKIYSEYEAYKEAHRLLKESEGPEGLEKWQETAANYPDWAKEDPPTWKEYAKEKEWSSDPDHREQKDITEQYVVGSGCLAVAAIIGLMVLLNRRKRLTADAESIQMPNGDVIAFANVTRVDKRKWKTKGLATLTYSDGGGSKKGKLDCLKYDTDQTENIMTRLLANLKEGSEIIELAEDPEDESPENEASQA